ncbi:DUF485 domain-containing protein [Hufsiella ginkgonis]|uniref:DUF485 domain-containing protein n=1 Tax=Hufsiella ginkgonis TaxID=2695274 RepID=A0A7K1Y168_9SPHI|nr:DUF485 domain-containing protein [Hufsiella ginkgonis]MXV16994.1 DUF485 domain-containing protein [Hufsiella ginkgonis]
MHHGPAAELGVDNASAKKSRLGVWFFFVYLFFYAGFVVIGVLNYELLSHEVWGGLNLAIVYGIGLIVFAVLLGVIYNYLCSQYEDSLNREEQKP